MKNRKSYPPIIRVIVLLLVAGAPIVAKAQTGVSNTTTAAPAAQTSPAAASGTTAPVPMAKGCISYTVVAGDSLTSLAQKFNTTRKKLKEINNLTSSTLKAGQILQVPSLKSGKSATTASTSEAKRHHAYPMAQPVQDFDIPASTFASCPVPLPSSDQNGDSSAPMAAVKPAPIAKLVSPAELTAETASANAAPAKPDYHFSAAMVPSYSTRSPVGTSNASSGNASQAPQPFNPPSSKLSIRSPNQGQSRGVNPATATPAEDWGSRFLQVARVLGNQGIEYDEDWRPPGESHAWTMDCSNTARYIYKVATGIQLPRTASDQYYYLHLQGKAWDVPQTAGGWADCNYLRSHLKPGDLLFWENTYRPERQPPITHVMVFLGTNERGQWIMAGSQTSSGGEHNRSNGGPDIYIFRPTQPCGGYSTWLGLVHHQGRFCAFGRPLEADRSKLAVAESN
jgi:LysM repeat protein